MTDINLTLGERSVQSEILRQLDDIRNSTHRTAESIARMEGQLSVLPAMQSKTDANTSNIVGLTERASDLEKRMDRAEASSRWAIGIAITAVIAVCGFVVTWLSAVHK